MSDLASGHGAAPVKVAVRRLPAALDLPLPSRATAHAAGFDLRAAVDLPIVVPVGGRALVPTGVAIAVPPGYEAQIRPRSGLALRHGIGLINSPGTIDSDYRGEIGLPVINLGGKPYTIRRGERVAQLVIQAVCRVDLRLTLELDATERGGQGFGHSGD